MSKTCFRCETELPQGASFCPGCGKDVRPAREKVKKEHQKPEQTAASQKALDEYRRIRHSIAAQANWINKRVMIVQFAATLICLLAVYNPLDLSWADAPGAVAGIVCIVCFFLYEKSDRWLEPGEYYQIEGSRANDGKHRCISCGNRGIYRKGEYASDVTYAMCSKCNFPFFAM